MAAPRNGVVFVASDVKDALNFVGKKRTERRLAAMERKFAPTHVGGYFGVVADVSPR